MASCPCVVTLHDAIDLYRWPRFTSWRQAVSPGNWMNYASHVIARKKPKKIITVSNYSKVVVSKQLGIHSSRICVIAEAADPIFDSIPSQQQVNEIATKFGLGSPYFFYVGGFDPRKNLGFLLNAFASLSDLDVCLVLAGGSDESRLEFEHQAERLGIARKVHFLGRVQDEVLPALYRGALATVYPSLQEGFGLQLCEAMAMECPILSSNATSLPEVLGEGGIQFSPTDLDQLANSLRKLVEDSSLRCQLSQKSSQRGKSFSWDKAARETYSIYESIARLGDSA